MVESSLLRPDYPGYFNEIAGGPKNGYKHLVDNSPRLGPDLPVLRKWLSYHFDHLCHRLYPAYFGTALPQWYGIEGRRCRLIVPRKNYRGSNPAPTVSAQLLFSRSIPFNMVNGRTSTKSDYQFALARTNESFDLPAIAHSLMTNLTMPSVCSIVCLSSQTRADRNPWKFNFGFSTQSTRTGSGAIWFAGRVGANLYAIST